MNYIELINQFWQLRRSKRITNLQADLYYFLIQESSSRGVGNNWENPFQCSNGLVCTSIGITEKSLIDARNVLQQLGLIEFEPGITKRKSPVYYLPDSSNPVGKRGGNRGGNQVSNRGGNQVYINKGLNETQPNETSISHTAGKPAAPKKKQSKKVRPYWDAFKDAWHQFYESKFQEKFQYLEKDWNHLARIYDFLRKRAAEKNAEWTEQSAIEGFRAYLTRAYEREPWIRNHFSISNLLTQFNQIANGNSKIPGNAAGRTKTGRGGTIEDLQALKRRSKGATDASTGPGGLPDHSRGTDWTPAEVID